MPRGRRRAITQVIITDASGMMLYDVSASFAQTIAVHDPFQAPWTATTPDDFRALFRFMLAHPDAPRFDVYAAAGLVDHLSNEVSK